MNNKLLIVLSVMLVLVLTGCGQYDTPLDGEKVYLSIDIKRGDTLTAIANEYMCPGYSHESFIDEVKAINMLTGDTIYAGSTLMIPIVTDQSVAYDYER